MPAVLRWRAAAESSRPRPRQETCACSLALVLRPAQDLLDPLQGFLEEHWGGAWYYRPAQMLLALLLYLLSGYRNPEQVKAAPAPDFGPFLGRRRAPACVTNRERS
jgi:hypothetical protein